MPIFLYAAIAAVVFAAGFAGGIKTHSVMDRAALATELEQQQREEAKRLDRATAAATAYEAAREAQRVRTITVTREVQREVLADADCSARALPDGLRDALTTAAADADQPRAAGPVPAASAAPAGDVGGSGSGLRRPAFRVDGVPIAAPGAR